MHVCNDCNQQMHKTASVHAAFKQKYESMQASYSRSDQLSHGTYT